MWVYRLCVYMCVCECVSPLSLWKRNVTFIRRWNTLWATDLHWFLQQLLPFPAQLVHKYWCSVLRHSAFGGCRYARVFAYFAGSFLSLPLFIFALHIFHEHLTHIHIVYFSAVLSTQTLACECRTPHILPADVSDVTVRMHSKSVTSNFTLSEGGTCSISQPLIRSLVLEVCVSVCVHIHTSVWVCVCAVEAARGITISVCQIRASMFVRKIKKWSIMCFHVLIYDTLFICSSNVNQSHLF